MNIKGQGHSLTFIQGHSDSIEAKFRIEPPWDIGMKICSNVPGHMAEMASRLIYGKILEKKILLRNQGADDL